MVRGTTVRSSFAFSDSVRRCKEELNTLVDRTHAFFDEIEARAQGLDDGTVLLCARLVAHEWIANLIQYADFGGETPEITIAVELGREAVHYTIEDNSHGFDLNAHLQARRNALRSLPDRGMGLLLIHASTDRLSYVRLADGRHRLRFSVRAEPDPVRRRAVNGVVSYVN